MLGRNEEALEAVDKAIELKTEYREAAWINRGSALTLLERYAEALDAFGEALSEWQFCSGLVQPRRCAGKP
jgi:tetratricopeptide (TPR) repeat protein